MRLRFVLCRVALAAFRQAIPPRGLKNFSVNAAPPTRLAISDRLFFRCKPLPALLSAFDVRHLNDLPLEAVPTPPRHALFFRFTKRVVTSATSGLAIIRPPQVDDAVNAAVAPIVKVV